MTPLFSSTKTEKRLVGEDGDIALVEPTSLICMYFGVVVG